MARTQEPKTYDKPDSLKLTTDQIEKKFGKGSIMKLGEGSSDLEVGVIPTGALAMPRSASAASPAAASSKSTAPNQAARPRWLFR
mgnify:CR=1 FL=1